MVQRIQKTVESPQLQYTEKKVDVFAEQDREGLTGAGRAADSGNPKTKRIDRAANVLLVTQTGVDHQEDPEDCRDTAGAVHPRCDEEGHVLVIQRAVQKTVELRKVQHSERIVDVTVMIPHQVPTIQSVQKMLEVRQSQYLDRVVDVPVGMKRQISLSLQVTSTAEIPLMPFMNSRCPAARV